MWKCGLELHLQINQRDCRWSKHTKRQEKRSKSWHYVYNTIQNKTSGVYHKYVMNEFLIAHRSCTTKYFWKNLYRSYASFGTFCFQIGQLFETQRDSKLSEEFEIDVIFQWFYRFQTFFKESLCLEKLINLDAKFA